MRQAIEWLRFGSDLKQASVWISEHLVSLQPIEGGCQVNISYWGLTLLLGLMVWRHKAAKAKLARAKG